MANTSNTDTSKRFSIKVLPYDQKDKAVAKELIIDYKTGHIYVVAEDGVTILSITKELEQLITNFDGDTINVNDPTDNDSEKILNNVLKNIYSYINNAFQGISLKKCARVLSETNLTLSGDPGVIDGIDTNDGDVILLINQSNPVQNGKWVINFTGDWVRAEDLDETEECAYSALVFIQEGTKYSQTGWLLATTNAIVGESELEWQVFTRADEITVLSGGGITKEGNVISLSDITTAGSATKVQWDSKGRIIGYENPTTLAEYGITDGVSAEHIGSGGDQHSIANEDEAGFESSADYNLLYSIMPSIEALEADINTKMDTKAEVEFLTEEAISVDMGSSSNMVNNLTTDDDTRPASGHTVKALKDIIDSLWVNNSDGSTMKIWTGSLSKYYSLQEKDSPNTLYISTDYVSEETAMDVNLSSDELITFLQSMQTDKVSKSGDQMYGPLIIGSTKSNADLKVYGNIYVNGVNISNLYAAIDHTHAGMVTNTALQSALTKYALVKHTHQISEVDGLQKALDSKASVDHTHEDLYYNQEQLDFKFTTKAAANHTHPIDQVDGLKEYITKITGGSLYLSDMIADSTHRTVTDAQIEKWDAIAKDGVVYVGSTGSGSGVDTSVFEQTISDIRSKIGETDLISGTDISTTINNILQILPGESSGIYLKKAISNVVLDTETNTIPLGIEGYDSTKHTLFVFRNSTFMPNTDYTLTDDNVVTTENSPVGTVFSFVVLWIEGDLNVFNNIFDNISISSVTGLAAALSGKAPTEHTHNLADLTEDSEHRTVTDAQISKWTSGTGSSSVDVSEIEEKVTNIEANLTTLRLMYQVVDFEATMNTQTSFTINVEDLADSDKYGRICVIGNDVITDYTLEDYKLVLKDAISKGTKGHLILFYVTGNVVANKDVEVSNIKFTDLSTSLQNIINNKLDAADIYTREEVDGIMQNINDIVSNAGELLDTLGTIYSSEQIDDLLTNKMDADKCYTKDEIQELLGTSTGGSGYTTSEIDDKLSEKADADKVYTKDDIDAMLKLISAGSGGGVDSGIANNISELTQATETISGNVESLSTNLSENYYNKDSIDSIIANLYKIVPVTQSAYDALTTKDDKTFYAILK